MADITVAPDLTAGIAADSAIADKGYDSQEVVDALAANGSEAVISPVKNSHRRARRGKIGGRLVFAPGATGAKTRREQIVTKHGATRRFLTGRLFLHAKTASASGNMTNIYTGSGTWWKTASSN